MEPVDPPLPSDELSSPPVSWVGDPLGAPLAGASVDALRQVLARHRRRQRVLAGVGMAVVLVAGSVAGFAIGQQGRGTGGTQVAAADQPASPAPVAPTSSGSAPAVVAAGGSGGGGFFAPPGSSPATQLLLRNATDGVRVRLYAQAFLKPTCAPNTTCAAPAPGCFPTQILQAEVSDDQVAGQTGSPVWQAPPSTGLDPVDGEVVGDGQPQPILVLVAHAGTDVAQVELSSAYGNDSETPTAGWVALAVQLPADYQGSASDSGLPAGTVTALSSSGATISSAPVAQLNPKMMLPASCVPSPPVCDATPPSGGTSTAPVTPCACKQLAATNPDGAAACAKAQAAAQSGRGSIIAGTSGASSGSFSIKGSAGEPAVGATPSAVPTTINRP
jgi:hypothetical protein